ncbi:hypothetical protein [Candidatus Nucleicultrix amoebiphila]|jgi:hypothetical protein|uniref:Uncharacterized protein n=1 Tax=Candidatus Nucleicultrix amoebiphila FS5 TaxID=1414854 RepID=A0A1W6N3U1_9PROT|nr:hypothetical protein [Candidatus Nucleicultrix amoebiphila]ARN84514.1 hypothetical protein GQ61_03345 [Candidatus Nucleicultrix amoebiphila FS5]
MIKKISAFLLISTLSVPTIVHAEYVKSGSKYPIVVEVSKGTATCGIKSRELDNVVGGIQKSFEKTKGDFWDKLSSAIQQGVRSTITSSGCELIGMATTLTPGESLNLPVGTIIVAYKDPAAAWKQSKKVVNPLPATCKITAGKTALLETRKSEGLRSLIGIAGDGGLGCTLK